MCPAPRPGFVWIALALGLVLTPGCRTTGDAQPEQAPRRAASTEPVAASAGAVRVQDLLRGQVAGVTVVDTPTGFAVRIRGTSSLLGSNDPLYVVDGVPQAADRWGGVAHVSPRDVAQIRVLKDAQSMAEYGVRGANGVVVITTKRSD